MRTRIFSVSYTILFFLLLFPNALLNAYDLEVYHHEDHLSDALMNRLNKLYSLDTLVETGTYVGETTLRALPFYKQIYTVEIQESLYRDTAEIFTDHPTIHSYCDNSHNFLKLPEVSQARHTLYWLDAHFSGGSTGTLLDEKDWVISPLKHEVEMLVEDFKSDSIIVMDDMRGYLNLRLEEKAGRIYANISDIKAIVARSPLNLRFYILGDLGIIYDHDKFPATVSPAVEACTVSYQFNHHEPFTDAMLQKVIASELALGSVINSDEFYSLNALFKSTFLHDEDLCGFYSHLWQGLILMHKKKFKYAIPIFENIEKLFIKKHDRIYLYLAYCYNRTYKNEARDWALSQISERTLQFKDLLGL